MYLVSLVERVSGQADRGALENGDRRPQTIGLWGRGYGMV